MHGTYLRIGLQMINIQWVELVLATTKILTFYVASRLVTHHLLRHCLHPYKNIPLNILSPILRKHCLSSIDLRYSTIRCRYWVQCLYGPILHLFAGRGKLDILDEIRPSCQMLEHVGFIHLRNSA